MTEPIRWTPITVALGDLQPWQGNPRQSSKAQARRILKSFADFGQVHPVAVGPGLEVYDGHQRLSALLTVHGKDYQIDARQASRALTDDERRRLVLALHAGAVGSWDWDALSGWDAPTLIEGGFDGDLLKDWKRGIVAVSSLFGAEGLEVLGDDGRIDKEDRGGSSPWDRVLPSGKMRVLIGDIEFGITGDVYNLWLLNLDKIRGEATTRETAERWLTTAITS